MPFIVPLIPIIATAAISGLEMAGVGRPSTPKTVDPTKVPLTATQNKAEQTAVGQALPDLQSLTGGSLSPEYAAQFGATQAGLANDPKATGNIQEAINQFFGLAAPGKMGLTTAANTGGGLGDFIRAIPGLIPNQAPAGSDWVTQTLQGNDFRGLAG